MLLGQPRRDGSDSAAATCGLTKQQQKLPN
jgi:hypothetical protein